MCHFTSLISSFISSFDIEASEEPEERETLALMAARGDSEETQDGETYIEKYTRGVLEVENILSLEKLRQVIRACFRLVNLQESIELLWWIHILLFSFLYRL